MAAATARIVHKKTHALARGRADWELLGRRTRGSIICHCSGAFVNAGGASVWRFERVFIEVDGGVRRDLLCDSYHVVIEVIGALRGEILFSLIAVEGLSK
jgi:hypothetical protein